jgi:transcription elongation GreA/GreB family factor
MLTYEERKMVAAIQKRIDYLLEKIEKAKAMDRPTSFDEVEVRALSWSLSIVERWFNNEEDN